MSGARIVSVNVGTPRETLWNGRVVTSAIWKTPVTQRTSIRGVNLDGDDQADRTVHGGPDKAVYAYSLEDYAHWRDREGVETEPALFGENLTTTGIDLNRAIVGSQWHVGSATLEVAQPRLPCFKLGMRLADVAFPKHFQRVARMGAYLRIISEGDVGAGDAIEVIAQPDHGITLSDMVSALHNEEKAHLIQRIDRLPAFWHDVAYRKH